MWKPFQEQVACFEAQAQDVWDPAGVCDNIVDAKKVLGLCEKIADTVRTRVLEGPAENRNLAELTISNHFLTQGRRCDEVCGVYVAHGKHWRRGNFSQIETSMETSTSLDGTPTSSAT